MTRHCTTPLSNRESGVWPDTGKGCGGLLNSISNLVIVKSPKALKILNSQDGAWLLQLASITLNFNKMTIETQCLEVNIINLRVESEWRFEFK